MDLIAAAILLADGGVEEEIIDERNDNLDADERRLIKEALTLKWSRMGDPTFKTHFRMDKCLFEVLLVTVGRHMDATGRILRRGAPISTSLMMTLWMLANPDTFRAVGEQFGVAKGSVHSHYRTMIEVFCELRCMFIKWPSPEECARIQRHFENRYGYPGVIGCIDGSHIPCTAPLEQAQRYVNRHHNYSVILQAVCDHELVFRDVYIGEPGAVGDARTFQRSPLCNQMLREEGFMDEDEHLLGDGAYTCIDKLLTPFRDFGNQTRRQRAHNFILARVRSAIERAFALLKGRWRRLKHFPHFCYEYFLESILASVVLHNFVRLNGVPYVDEGDPVNPVLVDEDVPTDVLLRQARRLGQPKREYIATMLYPII